MAFDEAYDEFAYEFAMSLLLSYNIKNDHVAGGGYADDTFPTSAGQRRLSLGDLLTSPRVQAYGRSM